MPGKAIEGGGKDMSLRALDDPDLESLLKNIGGAEKKPIAGILLLEDGAVE